MNAQSAEPVSSKGEVPPPVEPGLQCPRCRSTQIKLKTRYLVPAFTVLFAGVLMRVSLPFGDPPEIVKALISLPVWVAGGVALLGKSSCGACGHRWR
jgi:hypothetical protein